MPRKRLIALILTICFCFSCWSIGFASESDDWWNILLLGCDSYTAGNFTRTDSMIIASLNLKTGEAKMTSLMRDMQIKDPVTGAMRKLTELCAVGNGPERTIQAINKNLGMNIEKYALITMDGIAAIIDLMGGIDLDVTEAERKALNKGLFDLSPYSAMEELEESGPNVHLNGNQATAYARIRKIDSDYVRTERQRIVLTKIASIMRQNLSAENMIMVINNLLEYVITNLNTGDIIKIASMAMKIDTSNIQEFRIPADGTFRDGMFGNIWCIKPNYKKNTELLHQFIYG